MNINLYTHVLQCASADYIVKNLKCVDSLHFVHLNLGKKGTHKILEKNCFDFYRFCTSLLLKEPIPVKFLILIMDYLFLKALKPIRLLHFCISNNTSMRFECFDVLFVFLEKRKKTQQYLYSFVIILFQYIAKPY